MSDQWFWAKGKQKCGPFSYEQLRQMAGAGILSPSDMVFNEGASQWVPARDVPGLAFPADPAEPTKATAVGVEPAAPQGPAWADSDRVATARREQPPASSPRLVDTALAVAALLSVPSFCLNEFLGKPFLILAGLIWIVFGVRAVATGSVPSFSGTVRRRPVAYRVGGVLIVLFGLSAAIGGTVELLHGRTGRPQTSAAPSPAAAPANTTPPKQVQAPEQPQERLVSFGDGQEVRYQGELQGEAERLGRALQDMGYFDGVGPKTVRLMKSISFNAPHDDIWIVDWFWDDAALNDPVRLGKARNWQAIQLAALAFPDKRVQLILRNQHGEEKETVPAVHAGRRVINDRAFVYYASYIGTKLGDQAQRVADLMGGSVDPRKDLVFILEERVPFVYTLVPLHNKGQRLSPEQRRSGQVFLRELSRRAFDGGDVFLQIPDHSYNPGDTIERGTDTERAEPREQK